MTGNETGGEVKPTGHPTLASPMCGWKRKLVVLAMLVLGAPLGLAISLHLWSAHVVEGGDDPTMLLVLLCSTVGPALLGAWCHWELLPRLIAYPLVLAALARLLRPGMDGIAPYPRESSFFGHYVLEDFYPPIVTPAAVVGGIVAVVFTRLFEKESEIQRGQ